MAGFYTHDTLDPAFQVPLTSAIHALDLAPEQVQVFDPAYPRFDAQRRLLVLPLQFELARAAIDDRYSAGHAARTLGDTTTTDTTVGALPDDARAWLLEPLAPEEDIRAFAGLRAIIERLRAPEGCPWDAEQSHESLRRYLIEESYEAVDAIDRGDLDALREELGDVLAQVLMQTAIAQEQGDFTLEDVLATIAEKMVRRHPHVFAGESSVSSERLLERWDQLKAEERATSIDGSEDDPLASVPLMLPALQRAQSLLGRAERAGLDTESAAAGAASESESTQLAAMLWEAVRFARAHDLDAESVLRDETRRFAAERGSDVTSSRSG